MSFLPSARFGRRAGHVQTFIQSNELSLTRLPAGRQGILAIEASDFIASAPILVGIAVTD